MIQRGETIPIPGELESVSVGGRVSSTSAIFDYNLEKSLEEINALFDQLIQQGGSSSIQIILLILNLSNSVSGIENDLDDLKGGRIDSYPALKDAPDAYIRNVQYDIANANVSYVGDYIQEDLRTERYDQPLGITPYKFSGNLYYSRLLDAYESNSILTEASYNYIKEEKIYNLIPEFRYFYKSSDNKVKSFTVNSKRRFIWADDVKNVRDIGGIPTKNGGYIAYDKIFRGSELQGTTINASTEGLNALKALGITMEVDLRSGEEAQNYNTSLLGETVLLYRSKHYVEGNIFRGSFWQFKDIEILSDSEKYSIKDAFETIANEVIAGGKVYMHCVYGYHRCGFLSALIEGILGATQYEIDKDFELSSFSPLGEVKRTDNQSYKDGIEALNAQYGGSWIKLALKCGISLNIIERFKKAMVVDYQEQEELITEAELDEILEEIDLVPEVMPGVDVMTEGEFNSLIERLNILDINPDTEIITTTEFNTIIARL